MPAATIMSAMWGSSESKNRARSFTLGGSAAEDADIGKIIGPAFATEDVVDAVETLVDTYLDIRVPGERFLDTYRRTGADPFKERLYAIA